MRRDKAERGRKLMVGFIGLIMIGSIFGVIFFGFRSGGATTRLEYNGFDFIRKGNVWTTRVNGVEAVFSYLPRDVEFIFTSPLIKDRLKNKLEIDVTSDVNDTNREAISLAQFQIGSTLQPFNIFVRSGFTGNNSFNFPVLTCNDATNFVPVIYFKTSNQTVVLLEDNCIIIEASQPADFIRIKDRLIYEMFDIIK